jgi:hypothetical protein
LTKLYATLKTIQLYAITHPEIYNSINRDRFSELVSITAIRLKIARYEVIKPEKHEQEIKLNGLTASHVIVDESYLWLNPGKEQTENKHCASCTSCTNHCSESHEHKTSTEQLIKRHFTDLISDFIRNTRKIS